MANYNTTAELDTFFAGRLNTTPYDNAMSGDKTKAATQATAIVDRLNYLGKRLVATQDNEFPRDPDASIPQDIKDAHALIVLALLDGREIEAERDQLDIVNQTFANVKASFNRAELPPHILAGVLSFEAWTILKPYLRDQQAIQLLRAT